MLVSFVFDEMLQRATLERKIHVTEAGSFIALYYLADKLQYVLYK